MRVLIALCLLVLAGCSGAGVSDPNCPNGICYLPKSRGEFITIVSAEVSEEKAAWSCVIRNDGRSDWRIRTEFIRWDGDVTVIENTVLKPKQSKTIGAPITVPFPDEWKCEIYAKAESVY